MRYLIASMAIAASTTFTALGATLYVTPAGAGNKDGSDWANAFAGIQAAVDAADAAYAADGTLHEILVTNGVYSRVVVSRNFALQVRSVNGAAETIIDGYNTNNCVRCYAGWNYTTAPTFTGFTLQNGNARINENWNEQDGGGAAGGTLVDCIVQDCVAYSGGGTSQSDTLRCIIRRCSAPGWGGGGVDEGTHRNTLIHDCSTYVAIVYHATLYNCTVADTTAESDFYGVCYNSSIYNCIFWNNFIKGEWAAGNDAEDPKFVGDGDYRARVGSPAIDGGDADYVAEAGSTDLAGNARVQGSAIDRGCYEGPGVEGFRVTAVADGNGSVSPTYIFTNANAVVTITADTSVCNRPVTAWYTNGVLAATGGDTLTLAPLADDIAVTASFEVYEWFVDAANGKDPYTVLGLTFNGDYDGRSWTKAFKSIGKAIESAQSGESVSVAAGNYDPIDTAGKDLNIVGVAGAAATVIDGGSSSRCALLSDGATLTGFTLQNGKCISTTENDGGACARGGTLVGCVLRNGIATYGGGAFDSTLVRCTVTDNIGDGGGLHSGIAYDSFFGFNGGNQGGAAKYSDLYNCTVVGNRAYYCGALFGCESYNGVFYGNRTSNRRTNYSVHRYVGNSFDQPNLDDEDGEWWDATSFTGDPRFVDPENGDYRLRAGSPCIDGGDASYLRDAGDTDLDGNPRIVGEAPDLGCYEGGVEGFVVSVRTDGHGLVSDRTIVVAEGGGVTVTATEDGRSFLHWLVDGEQVRSGLTLTLDNIDADHVVTACFERRTTNVTGGGDALQNAISAAVDGDTLRVAAGIYSAIDAEGRVLHFKSVDGPARTIIQGNNAVLNPKRAVKCSYTLMRPNCTFDGFTIENGRTYDTTSGGGAIVGGSLSNCVIRNSWALLGGGAAFCELSRCTISNNTALVMGGGAAESILENCLVVGNNVPFDPSALSVFNIPQDFGGGAGIAYASADFCTITENTTDANGGGGYFVVLDNTYIAGNTAAAGTDQNIHWPPVDPRYVCTDDDSYWTIGFVNADEDDTFVDAAGGNWRLKPTSLCLDGGDDTHLEIGDGVDLAGKPRWRAGAPDIGCYESDSIVPAAVTAVSATRSDEREDVEISWKRARGAERYAIYATDTPVFAGTNLLATARFSASSFVDDTAAYATKYWYWVVPSSEAGAGEAASDCGYWTTPLTMTTASLPSGTSPYSKPLAATGGIGPYEWSVYDAKYQFTTNDVCTFDEDGDGTRLGYDYFDGLPTRNSWTTKAVPLPFKFPYFGVDYTNVWLHSGGLLVFGDAMPYEVGNDERNIYSTNNFTAAEFLSMPAIAPYLHANYGGIYMAVGESSVTFRWAGSCYYFSGGNGYAWFSLTLYPNGEFDFKYGDDYGTPYDTNNEPYARYGWSSGTGEGFLALVGGSLAGAPDRCIRYAPAPAWLSARTDQSAAPAPGVAAGVISATPPATTNSEIVVAVADDDGRASYRRFRLIVNSSGSLTGYAAWAAVNGLGAADAVTDGQPNLIRYAFDKPTGAFSPFTGISFNASGKPVVTLRPLVNTDGVTVKVLSTTDLTDWSHPEVRTLTISDNGTLIFDHATDPQRFYRLKAE